MSGSEVRRLCVGDHAVVDLEAGRLGELDGRADADADHDQRRPAARCRRRRARRGSPGRRARRTPGRRCRTGSRPRAPGAGPRRRPATSSPSTRRSGRVSISTTVTLAPCVARGRGHLQPDPAGADHDHAAAAVHAGRAAASDSVQRAQVVDARCCRSPARRAGAPASRWPAAACRSAAARRRRSVTVCAWPGRCAVASDAEDQLDVVGGVPVPRRGRTPCPADPCRAGSPWTAAAARTGRSVSSPTSTTRPVKPSPRSVSAALAPASEAPTITNVRSSVIRLSLPHQPHTVNHDPQTGTVQPGGDLRWPAAGARPAPRGRSARRPGR